MSAASTRVWITPNPSQSALHDTRLPFITAFLTGHRQLIEKVLDSEYIFLEDEVSVSPLMAPHTTRHQETLDALAETFEAVRDRVGLRVSGRLKPSDGLIWWATAGGFMVGWVPSPVW